MTAKPYDQVDSMAADSSVSPAEVTAEMSTLTAGASRSIGVVVGPSKTPSERSLAQHPQGLAQAPGLCPVLLEVESTSAAATSRSGASRIDREDVGHRGIAPVVPVGEQVDGGADDGLLRVADRAVGADQRAERQGGVQTSTADLGTQPLGAALRTGAGVQRRAGRRRAG